MEKRKSKRLADSNAEDTFGNNEESRLQFVRCSRNENDCGTLMLIRTRSKGLAEQGDGSTVSAEATDGSTVSAGATDGSAASDGAVSNPSCKPIEMDQEKSKKMISIIQQIITGCGQI